MRVIDGKPLPRSVVRRTQSPFVVRIFDRIRQQLDHDDAYDEFSWFAREYPRCYRFHLNGADFRLRSIHELLGNIRKCLPSVPDSRSSAFYAGVSNRDVEQVYWDFESYLSEINISLDLLARIVGPAFSNVTPLSFNKFCNKLGGTAIGDIFLHARKRWVQRLKDYRDCFVHYTPVDTLLSVALVRYSDGWELRAKLPVNPNVREMLGFRYSRRVELFHYATVVRRHMAVLDGKIGAEIWKLFKLGQFPIRKDNLFYVGQRFR